jgi:hypothetical protein
MVFDHNVVPRMQSFPTGELAWTLLTPYPDQLEICADALTGAHAAGELIQVLARIRKRAINHVGLNSGDLLEVAQ